MNDDDRRHVAPPWSRHLRARVATGVVVALLVPFAAIAVRLDRPPRDLAVASTPASSTTTAPATTTTTTAPTTTTTTRAVVRSSSAAPTTTTTTLALAVATPGPDDDPIEPGPLRAPTPGTYAMHVAINGTDGDGILRVGDDLTEVRDLPTGTQLDGYDWSSGSALLVRSGRYDEPCAWTPAAMALPADLVEGRTWSSTTTCRQSTDDGVADVERDETAKVTQRARTTFGGAPVDTWLIERHLLVTVRTDHATSVTEEVSSELFAPALGLPIYRASRTDIPQADGTIESVLMAQELTAS